MESQNGSDWQLFVRRWNGVEWTKLGSDRLNSSTSFPRVPEASMVVADGRLIVAWEEFDAPTSTYRVFVKR